VFFSADFNRNVRRGFVPVLIDFPREDPAKAKVQDPARNERLRQRFQVEDYPRVVLTDAQGRPYGFTGYQEGGPQAYFSHLLDFAQVRSRRDDLLAAVDQASGAAKLDAARAVYEFLNENGLLVHYGPLVQHWVKLAGEYDAQNEQGFTELF